MANDLYTALSSLKIDRRKAQAGRGFWIAGVVAGLIVASGGAILVAKPYVEARLFTTPVSTTQVSLLSPGAASSELSASGYARTDAVSRVSPRVPGLVKAVHVKQGDKVEPQQLLYELDATIHRAHIVTSVNDSRAASAAASGARARASVTASELEQTTRRAQRERRLAEAGVSPAGAADDLAADVSSVKARVAAAEAEAAAAAAQVRALDSRTRALQATLNDLVILSPISGTIVGKPPQVGEYIDPQFNGGLRIADLSQLVIEVDVPEGKLGMIKAGGPAQILLEAYPERRFRGEVKDVLPEVDRGKATVSVRVAFLDDNSGVLPEMSARVSFLSRAEEPGTVAELPKKTLPSAAVTERGKSKVVFVIETDRVRMVSVKLGAKVGTSFELIEGPPAGTVVVEDPSPTLADGNRVKMNP